MLVARRLRLSLGRATATSLLIPKRGVSRLLWVSSFHRRGRSAAAHAPSEVPKAQEDRKRVSKDERKALVESYICKYRSLNGGKFPSVSAAKREVGGSYYVVRQLLQEIEYGYKTSSLEMKNEKLVEQRKISIIPKAAGSELTKECKIKEQSKKIVNDGVLGDSTVQNVEYKATPNPTFSSGGVFPKKTLDTKTEDDTSRDFSNQCPMVNDGEAEGISKKHSGNWTKECKIKEQSKKIVNDDVLGDSTVQNVDYKATPNPTFSSGGVLPKKTLDTKTEDDTSKDFSNESPILNDGEAEGISKKHAGKNKQRKENKQFVKDSTVDDKTRKVVTSREDSNLSDAAESSKELRRKAGEDLYRSGRVKHNMKKEASFQDTLDRGDLHKDKSEKDMSIKKHEEAPKESSSFWGSLKSLAAGVIKIWSNKR